MDYIKTISTLVSENYSLDEDTVTGLIEIPPDLEKGDYSLPCFKLAKELKKAPPVIAGEIKDAIMDKLPDVFEKVEVIGPYLNFFLSKLKFTVQTVSSVLDEKESYGSDTIGEGRNVVIDYSSINIAKPFHIGHLSTTVIGNSLYRIFNYLGYNSVGVNHLGDWGTQFGKLVSAYKRWGDRETVEKGSIHALLELYVRFHEEAKNDPALDEEGRYYFKKIEDGDRETLELYEWFKELTLKEVQKIYDLLDVHFDSYNGEAFYNDKMQPVIDELDEKGLLKDSDGAKVVDLEDYGMPPCLIIKSDGATLYATRDLACAFYRKNTYDFYKNLYVVAYQQNLHFKQLFKVIELMGYEWAKDMEHIAFGMVSMTEGSLSTRSGRVIFLEDVLKQSIDRARDIIEEKNPDLENKEEIAKDVGIGALVYSTLSNSRIKDIVFDIEKILNFDGETGPYVQYSYARANSVLRKAPDLSGVEADYSSLDNPQSFQLAKLIADFPDTVKRAAEKYEPFFITRLVTSIAQAFNKFYYDIRIIEDDPAKTKAKIMLVEATAAVIKLALSLLGIHAPERM